MTGEGPEKTEVGTHQTEAMADNEPQKREPSLPGCVQEYGSRSEYRWEVEDIAAEVVDIAAELVELG
jgi:hypothetical protein